jgi:magnesium-transporting ATPase (P-type)
MVLLASAEEDGLCYVETANLDGETNLKVKYAWSDNGNLEVRDLHKYLAAFAAEYRVGCEAPNAK